MSLRLKLFLLFGGLIAALLTAQWLMVRALTRDVARQFENAAVSVGRDTATALDFHEVAFFYSDDQKADAGADLEKRGAGRRVFVKRVKTSSSDGVQTRTETVERHDGGMVWVDSQFRTTQPGAAPEKSSGPVMLRGPAPGASVQAIDGGALEEAQAGESPGAPAVLIDEKAPRARFQANMTVSNGAVQDVAVRVDAPERANFLILETPEFLTRIPLPREGLSDSMARLSGFLIGGTVAILALGLVIAGFLAYRLARPLTALSHAAQAVGQGRLGQQVHERGGDLEMRRAIEAFNGMSLRLRDLDAAERRHRERQALSELGEIARGFAHTIRNPLNTLGLSIEQMAALAPRSEECRDLAAASQRQIKRIDQWIRSFLALASEGRGQAQPVDLAALAHDVALAALQDSRDVRIEVDADPAAPAIRGVAPELRAVLQALTVNAVEASPPGGRVLITVRPGDGGGALIEVADEGSGVPEAVRQRLFTPHVTTKTHGSGMGLFLAHRLAASRYRGELALASLRPCGTKAILKLPKENDYDEHPHPGS